MSGQVDTYFVRFFFKPFNIWITEGPYDFVLANKVAHNYGAWGKTNQATVISPLEALACQAD